MVEVLHQTPIGKSVKKNPYLAALNLLDGLVGGEHLVAPVEKILSPTSEQSSHADAAIIQETASTVEQSFSEAQSRPAFQVVDHDAGSNSGSSAEAVQGYTDSYFNRPVRVHSEAEVLDNSHTYGSDRHVRSHADTEHRHRWPLVYRHAPQDSPSPSSGAASPSRHKATGKVAAESEEISLLAKQAAKEEARLQELEALLESQAADLEHLRAAADLSQAATAAAVGVDGTVNSESLFEHDRFTELPPAELAVVETISRQTVDCSKALQHTLVSCNASLLDAVAQRSTDTAMRVGALGEREDPADALWAEVLAQQALHLAELLRESRALRAQADLRARLARCSSKGVADRLDIHELRSRIGVQKQLTSKLLESSVTERSFSQGSSMQPSTAAGYAAGYAQGLKQCDVEEALVRFRSTSPHAHLMQMLDSRLGRADEVERIPATLGKLLEDDVAASAEVLLLECARLQMIAGMRRPGAVAGDQLHGLSGVSDRGVAARTAAAVEDHFAAQIQRIGVLCQDLTEEASALRSGNSGNQTSRSELS